MSNFTCSLVDFSVCLSFPSGGLFISLPILPCSSLITEGSVEMERHGKVFVKTTRRGQVGRGLSASSEGEGKLPDCFVLTIWWVALQVQKIVREHYLRDDIAMEPDGGWADGCCVLIDTNVALHQVRAQVSNAWRGCIGLFSSRIGTDGQRG